MTSLCLCVVENKTAAEFGVKEARGIVETEDADTNDNKKLSYRKETVRLLHNIEIRVLH